MAAQPIIAEERGTGVLSPPTASLPDRTVLDSLSPDDRLVLGHFLHEPIGYIDHPLLHEPQAEVQFFGGPAVLVSPTACRFVDPPAVVTRPAHGGSIPTLTSQQECILFLRYNCARMRLGQIREGLGGKKWTAKTTRGFLAWGHRALDARSTIAQLNLPLVMAMAKRTKLASIDHSDLISEGNMALLRSVEKFDCSRGYKFSTYACRAILKSFSRVAMRLGRYRGRFPTEFDPAIEHSDYLEHKRETIEIDCVEELKQILLRNLADLSDIERKVIHARFALGPVDSPNTRPIPKTLEQVGLMIGVTKERVRQIQNKALQKIRLVLEERYLAA